jgi:hypothetical protein
MERCALDERFDKLLKEARVELDEKKRAEYKQTHRSSIGQMHSFGLFYNITKSQGNGNVYQEG